MYTIKELCSNLNGVNNISTELYDLGNVAYLFLKSEEKKAEEAIKELIKKNICVDVNNACMDILLAILVGQNRFDELTLYGFPRNEEEAQIIGLYSQKANIVFNGSNLNTKMPDAVAGLPAITILINGTPVNLLFDTGAMITTISQEIAISCGLIPANDNIKGVGSTGAQLTVQPAMAPEICIGNIKLENKLVLVLPNQMLNFGLDDSGESIKIFGTIGWDIIKNFKWILDMKNRTVSVEESKMVLSEKNMCCDFYPMIRVTNDDTEMVFGLDTGANKTQLGDSLKSLFGELKKVKKDIRGAGALIEEEVFVAGKFSFNVFNSKITMHDVAVYDKPHSSSHFFVTPGIFGSDIVAEKK